MLKTKTIKGRGKRQRIQRKRAEIGQKIVAFGGFQRGLSPLIRRKKNQIKREERDLKIKARTALKNADLESANLKPVFETL